jgi:polyisoprenoid-binding protein YceI
MTNQKLPVGIWTIDAGHSHVEFAVRHMMIATVKGRFAEVAGTVRIPDSGGSPEVDVRIASASIDTRQEQRDAHLRSPDFFDAERYPEIRFVSTRAERKGQGWAVEGDLTMRGVTRPVALEVVEQGSGRDPWGNERLGVTAIGRLDRREWGLTWNQALETGGILVSDEVKITIEAELVRQAEAAQAA